MTNIDAEINKLSYQMFEKIKEIKENKENKENKEKAIADSLIDKCIGVLSQDGPYAYYVFVKSKSKNDNCVENVYITAVKDFFFGENGIFKGKIDKDFESSIKELSENIYQYLYFKELLEKVLIYLRYHLKTLEKGD